MIGWLLIAMKCLSHYQVSSLQAIPNPLYLLSYWGYPTLKKKKMPFVQPLLTQKMKGSENESYIGWTNSLLQWVPHPRLVILHWQQIFSMMRIPRDEKTMISMHKFVGLTFACRLFQRSCHKSISYLTNNVMHSTRGLHDVELMISVTSPVRRR